MYIFISSLVLFISSLMSPFGTVLVVPSVAPVAHTSAVVAVTQTTNSTARPARTIPIHSDKQPTSQKTAQIAEIQPTSNFTLTVGSSTYTTHIHDGDTLYDTMRALSSTTNFIFTGREYIGMGFFVESINGKVSADSHYWILYKNGTRSSTGVSQTTLHAGDVAEWKYEKSY